jgi:hypothetical protein
MIKTLGRNGPKVIQVDMAPPPPSGDERHEVSAEILQLHDDMDKLHQIIAQKGDLDGVFDFAHKMIDKAKAFQEAAKQKAKQVVHPNKVELPDKLYAELEAIINVLVRLAEALMAANSQAGPDDPVTGTRASTAAAAPPQMMYVIRGDN